ncbi:MAG: metal-dependent transcriptional regulator [Chloroflexota bacterium]|nr:metal-dependent transcriptional regulator [Chloroflexota bacterium]
MQDYLKVIYKLQQHERPVPTAAIAERLDLSAPAVSKMLKHLPALKLVKHSRYYRVELTQVGEKIALEVIRHHRLIELYLVKELGISWDRVDAEAEVLEHVISEELEERIADILGNPTHDPHGDPIPTLNGAVENRPYKRLSDVTPGAHVRVLRVPDRDPRLLQYLAEIGLVPQAAVELVRREPLHGCCQAHGDAEQAWNAHRSVSRVAADK